MSNPLRSLDRKLYLASTSPRRQELLSRLNLPYEVIEPQFRETPTKLSAEEECLWFAEAKARSVKSLCPNALVMGCDTLIECGGEKVGKPSNTEEATRILGKLSGRTHRVLSGVVLLDTRDDSLWKHLEIGRVTFRRLSTLDVAQYVATGEAMGKAGAYAVQGLARGLLIERVEGEEEAIIGLPLRALREWFGLAKTANEK